MLFERLVQAKKNLGIEEKLIVDKGNEDVKEEVIIGQDYLDPTFSEPSEKFEDPLKRFKEDTIGLDPYTDVDFGEFSKADVDTTVDNEFVATITQTPEFIYENSTVKCSTPSKEEREQDMDSMEHLAKEYPREDTSGANKSKVDTFLEKYAEGNDIIQILRKDLMSILSDVQWILESKNQHEQFSLDFADALNELSVKF